MFMLSNLHKSYQRSLACLAGPIAVLPVYFSVSKVLILRLNSLTLKFEIRVNCKKASIVSRAKVRDELKEAKLCCETLPEK